MNENMDEARLDPRPETEEACCAGPELQATPSNKIKDINIKELDHGYIVHVGCQTFAFENTKKLISALNSYLKEPAKVEENWLNNKEL